MCKIARLTGINFLAALANKEILRTRFESGFKANVKILKHGIYGNIKSVFNEAISLDSLVTLSVYEATPRC